MYAWGDNRRFNSYSGYFRRMFGCRVQKLSVDAGFTCPNRDGTISGGGCTFCNNGAFTPSYCMPVKGAAADRGGDRVPPQALPHGVEVSGLLPVVFEHLCAAGAAEGGVRRGAGASRRGGHRRRHAARLRGRRKAGLFRGAGAREVRGRRVRHRIDPRRDAAGGEPRA